ncbi:MAG: hypothetical protein DRP78_05710 [Candidatus Omnitrophota bacterium]|nr:MAG: hypothetical protein DRP78_05710 [Candidatus Omnitrophota bacterium]
MEYFYQDCILKVPEIEYLKLNAEQFFRLVQRYNLDKIIKLAKQLAGGEDEAKNMDVEADYFSLAGSSLGQDNTGHRKYAQGKILRKSDPVVQRPEQKESVGLIGDTFIKKSLSALPFIGVLSFLAGLFVLFFKRRFAKRPEGKIEPKKKTDTLSFSQLFSLQTEINQQVKKLSQARLSKSDGFVAPALRGKLELDKVSLIETAI